ncbi:MAG TPA: TIGR02186 family protein [Paracoccaceae bacterium]|nr:TIGR02186 family protein [Paracoccaceae bacterium]
MRLLASLLTVALLLGTAAKAEEQIVADLSQNRVAITANFQGSQIFIFGAVKRLSPVPGHYGPLDVVIEVSGPPEPITVRRKERKYGIWVNTDTMTVDRAPSYYAIASTAPVTEIISEAERLSRSLGLDYAVKILNEAAGEQNSQQFSQAVVRIRQDSGHYAESERDAKLAEDTLFTAEFQLPANLTEGDYTARMYLVRDKRIVNAAEKIITVRKTGMEKWLYDLAHEQPLIYGLLSIAVALFSGWAASEIFRRIRR